MVTFLGITIPKYMGFYTLQGSPLYGNTRFSLSQVQGTLETPCPSLTLLGDS